MNIPVKDIKIEKVDKITIQELYNIMAEDSVIDVLDNGTEVVNPNDKFECESLNGITTIKNISRHKVTKDKWEISIKDKKIQTTSDHSVMVYRDGNVIEVKPEDIKATDYLIVKKN